MFSSTNPAPRAIQGGVRGTAWSVSREALYYFLPRLPMMQGCNLIVAFVHGNALGVVLEPRAVDGMNDDDRKNLWKVCLGPLVEEVAIGSEYPKEDCDRVVKDLVRFLDKEGVSRSIAMSER
jgi:hypothetical protein